MGFVLFDVIGDAVSAAGDFFGDVAEGAMDILSTGAKYAGKAVSATADFVGNLASSAFSAGGKLINGFVTGAGNFLGGAVKTVGNVFSNIGGATMDMLGGAVNVLGKVGNGIIDFAGNVGNAFIDTVGKAYNATKGFVSGAINLVGDAFGGLVNFGKDVIGKVIDFGGDLINGAKDILGGIFNAGKDLIETGLDWLGGRTEAEHKLYANYEQVAIVCDELNSIAKKGMGDAQDIIFEAIDKLNHVKGFNDYVGYIDKTKYEEILRSLSEVVATIAKSIQEKAEDIKAYEESSLLEKFGSTLVMTAAKTTEGFLSILESIGDGGIYLAGWIGGILGNKEFQQDCEDLIEKDLSHDLLGFYYNSDFAKASVFKEESLATGAFKLVGKGLGMVAVGPAGVIASGFGKGVEGALQNGVSYNDAFGHGLVTAAAQGIAGNVILGAGVAGQALASTVGDVVADMAHPSAETPIELVEEDAGDETGDTGGITSINTTLTDTPTNEVQYRNTETVSGGGGTYVPRKETTTIDPIVPTTDPTTEPTTEPSTEPTTPATEPTSPPTTSAPTTEAPTTEVPTTAPKTDPSGYTVYVTPTNPPYYRVETSGMEYNGGNGPMEEVISDELDNSEVLADLDTIDFDNDLDEIVRENKFTKIPISTNPVQASKKNGVSGVVPIATGLSVAAAAGLGAKAYMDYKRNNSDLDENNDDEDELDEEDENISDEYSNSDNLEIEETGRDKELKENMNDYYQSDSVYTARDILEGI